MRLFSQDTKVAALARAPLFDGLSKKELTALARSTDDLEVDAGKVLCREGELGHEFFVIVEGEAEVRKDGRQVGTLGPGDFFGEIALVEKSSRTATVTATTPLRFFVLASQSFWSLLDHNPQVERKVLRALARRVLSS
ncbi:MAG: cyclic nucleotide-binding domain-containing protein [Thermoleophilia bacterium]|nr:cyclic nucleotide-binding domain-containing protein [Thermoleophilia bacterium]